MRPLLSEAIDEARDRRRPLVGDGAMGTQLQLAGLEPGGCGDEWNLAHPGRVLAIHRRYVEAGSQIVLTNTFGSNRFVLRQYGLEKRVEDICWAAAGIAREAAGEDRYVLGDVGPCGGFLAPLGDITEAELEESLRAQIGALLNGGVDGILLETMTALDELEAGVRLAKDLGAPLVIGSLAYDKGNAGFRTMMGVSPVQAAERMAAWGVDVVGANCGLGLDPEHFAAIARAYREVCDLPIMLQPNAGQPELIGAQAVYPTTPEQMGACLSELAGVSEVIGGCCGSAPEHIAAFSRRLPQSAHRAHATG